MENSQLASSLRTVISKMVRRLRRQMNAADSLSNAEIDTLSFLYQQGSLSPSELAELNKIKGQSQSEVLIRLKTLHLIDKQQSSADKRKFDVSLTDAGRRVVEQARYEREAWLSSAIARKLSEQERGVLEEAIIILQKLSDH